MCTSNQSLLRTGLEPAIKERSCSSVLLSSYTFPRKIFFAPKDYIMAGIDTPSTVSVQITSSMTSFTSEKRLQRNETISTLKVLTCVSHCVFMNLVTFEKICFGKFDYYFFSFHLLRFVVRIINRSLGIKCRLI